MKAKGMLRLDFQYFMCLSKLNLLSFVGILRRNSFLLVNRNINICGQIFVELAQQFLQHVVSLRPVNPFQNLRDVNQIADKFRSREKHLMLAHVVRECPYNLLIVARHQSVGVKLRVKLCVIIANDRGASVCRDQVIRSCFRQYYRVFEKFIIIKFFSQISRQVLLGLNYYVEIGREIFLSYWTLWYD